MMPNGVHRKLYDLAGAEDDRRTSPYCWRIRFALAHKGLEYQCVPWRRVEKDLIAFSRQDLVSLLHLLHSDKALTLSTDSMSYDVLPKGALVI